LPRTEKKEHRLPTVEEMLQFRPKRLDFEWTTNEDGLVQIKVPKFTSNLGKSFCNIIKKDNSFTANMDKIGSVVWKNCNGRNSVKEILDVLKKEFPKEKDIDNRLFLFLQQMHSLRYIML
jgi:hypothetical protein